MWCLGAKIEELQQKQAQAKSKRLPASITREEKERKESQKVIPTRHDVHCLCVTCVMYLFGGDIMMCDRFSSLHLFHPLVLANSCTTFRNHFT